MSAHLEFDQWVPFPVEQVFAFFSNPENLPRIMPEASAMKILALQRVPVAASPKAGGVGTTIDTTFRLFPILPFRGHWLARITEFEWNHHFADVQDKGPFRSWHHRHEFAEEVREGVTGTLVRDKIDYSVGFGWLGRIAESAIIPRQMRATFEQRHKKLPELLSTQVKDGNRRYFY